MQPVEASEQIALSGGDVWRDSVDGMYRVLQMCMRVCVVCVRVRVCTWCRCSAMYVCTLSLPVLVIGSAVCRIAR